MNNPGEQPVAQPLSAPPPQIAAPELQNETPAAAPVPAAAEKYKIENVSGFDVLKVTIDKPTESIYVKYDGQMVIDNSLKMEAVMGTAGAKKGMFSGLWAGVSTGSVFINRLFLDPAAGGTTGVIHISGIFPGSITEIDIAPGQSWLVASHCFLACTGDVGLTSRPNFNIVKFVAGLDLVFTEVSVPADKPAGKLWITSFGGAYKKEVNESTRNFRINPGLFMAAPTDIATALKTQGAGSLGAIFATGQFLMMDFSECPNGAVYLNTANEGYMIYKLTNKVNDANASIEITSNLVNDAIDFAGSQQGGTDETEHIITPTSSSFDDINKLMGGGAGKKKHYTRRLSKLRRAKTKRIYF